MWVLNVDLLLYSNIVIIMCGGGCDDDGVGDVAVCSVI